MFHHKKHKFKLIYTLFPRYLMDTPELKKYCAAEQAKREPSLLQAALRRAFLKLDETMRMAPAVRYIVIECICVIALL